MSKPVLLSPPNRTALWSSLALSKAQLAELCGLTTRQVSHWTLRGYIKTSGPNPDRYNGDAIDLCVLIKQGLTNGLSLRQAVAQAHAFINDERSQRPAVSGIEPAMLADIRSQLETADEQLRQVLAVVRPLVPRERSRGRNATAHDAESDVAR